MAKDKEVRLTYIHGTWLGDEEAMLFQDKRLVWYGDDRETFTRYQGMRDGLSNAGIPLSLHFVQLDGNPENWSDENLLFNITDEDLLLLEASKHGVPICNSVGA